MTGPASAPGGAVTLVEGSSFCLSSPRGDLGADPVHGLFVHDRRVVSSWELTVDGARPEALGVERVEPFAAVFTVLAPPAPGRATSLLVLRHRYVGDGMREDLVVHNGAARPATAVLRLAVGADFGDLFAVKEGRPAGAPATGTGAGGLLTLRGTDGLAVWVRGDGALTEVVAGAASLTWRVEVPARSTRAVTVEVEPEVAGVRLHQHHPRGGPVEQGRPARKLREWRRASPTLDTADPHLARLLQRSVSDVGALRIVDPDHPERAVVAAGAPWFMAVFGRDALLTSMMVLPLDPRLALGTLQTLAAHQGERVDPEADEEPGRIPHELRLGPPSPLAPGGRQHYYGTADATALFVVVLDELRRWVGPTPAVRALVPHADRALAWIEQYGERGGDGFVRYARRTPRGLLHQGWKDSHDGVTFADGRAAHPPIALAEVQAYSFAAYRARARLALALGDRPRARDLVRRAARLRAAFDERFWLPDREWFAFALDADGRRVDALVSNLGHCLWSGIVRRERAAPLARHLLSPDLFTGWGVRTLARSMGAYDPMSYHNGSVWPHDTALAVAGLRRYGFDEQARELARGLVEAAVHFDHRLPELFGGYGRDEFARPVPYPTSCSPQAWSAAAPVLLLSTLLGLAPEPAGGGLRCAPAAPAEWLPLRITGLRRGDRVLDVAVDTRGWSVRDTATPDPRPSRAGR